MRIFTLVILSILFVESNAQLVRKNSNAFLDIGVGAKALGMGNSIIATVSDVEAGYWNPSKLLEIKDDYQLSLMHAEYFAGISNYDYIGFARSIDENSAFGISVIRLAVDDIPNTIDLIDQRGAINYDRIRFFTVADYGILVSYARNVKGLKVGGNAKILYRQIGDFANAFGLGLDASISYDINKWNLAAVARDVTSTFTAWSYTLSDRTIEVFDSTDNVLPEDDIELRAPSLIIGLARQFELSDRIGLRAEVDLISTFDGLRNTLITSNTISMSPALGVEADFKNTFYLRLGLGEIQKKENFDNSKYVSILPSMGLGLKVKNFYIDYALTNIGDSDFITNVFSLKMAINRKG